MIDLARTSETSETASTKTRCAREALKSTERASEAEHARSLFSEECARRHRVDVCIARGISSVQEILFQREYQSIRFQTVSTNPVGLADKTPATRDGSDSGKSACL